MTRLTTATAIIAALSTPGFAQDAPFQLDEIVFSAGLTALEAARTGVSVEVVTEEELEEAGNIQLSDFLETLPGIAVTQNGPVGTNATLRIRGLNGNYIPVLINGIDMTDPSSTQTSYNFGNLTTAGIGRVEVLYGSQGPIYGSEAIAGVINITTIEAPEEIGTETTLNVEAGSYDTYRGSFGIATRFERGTLSFTAARTTTDGFSAADENLGNTEADGFRDTMLTLSATYDITDVLTVGADLIYHDSFVEFDAGGGAGSDADRFSDTERRGARIFAEVDGATVDQELSFQYSQTTRNDPNAPAFFSVTDFEGERFGLSYTATVDLAGEQSLVAGAEYVREDYLAFRAGGARFEDDYSIGSVFAEYTTAIGDNLDVSAALRYDDHSVYGGALTGRAALAWRPTADTVVRAAVATGFRAPSLNELYGPFGANPDLQPEESRSFELGVEHDFGRARLGAAVFYTEIDDLIAFAGGGYNQVEGTSVSQGFELTGEYDITENLILFGNYTYTDARDRNEDRLIRVPYHDLTVGIRGEFGDRWSGSFALQHVADRLDSQFPNIISMPDYTVANMSVGYAVTDDMELYLRVDNVFDEEYQTTVGYGTSDRAAYLGIRARF